ncbi:calcium-binding protein, partial [Oryzibacter oryziterrae]|uniref:calcium-binding protein n=1 Tax=Oryzibacter oryziterrae TaxID=2766474 RepID=UPI0036F35A61
MTVLDTATTGRIIKGTNGVDDLTGTAFSDTIYGYGGNDFLYSGTGGNDTFIGGPGADYIFIQNPTGNHTASYVSAPSGVAANLTVGTGTKGDAAGDTLGFISNLVGSPFGDTLVGNGNNNKLSGLGGNDALSGMAGNDLLEPGAGKDVVDGGDGVDVVSYAGISKGVTINLAVTDGSSNAGEAFGNTIL